VAHAPEIQVDEVFIADDNGLLDPGEITDIAVVLLNDGSAGVDQLITTLSTESSLVNLITSNAEIVDFAPDNLDTIIFNVSVSETALNGEELSFLLEMEGTRGYITSDIFTLKIGLNEENFETGDFSMINWGFEGDKPWQIDNYYSYEGQYSARSGFIIDNQSSSLIADVTVMAGGNVTFYKKVSCESNNADNFKFYIDDVEQDTWSGDGQWHYHSYHLDPGFHRLKWKYQKNENISANLDGVWLDLISFPALVESPPSLIFDITNLSVNMPFNQTSDEVLTVENTGEESIQYKAYISSNDEVFTKHERNIFGSYLYCDEEVVHAGETYQFELTVYNSSMDNEWIKEIQIDFPNGITLIDATNFTGNADDLIFEGELGNGATATWHGEDINGWGVLQGGNTATAIINVAIDESLTNHFSFSYEIYGDVYGGEPHIMAGELPFRNLGAVIDWMSIDQLENELEGGLSDQIDVSFNTWDLDVGMYSCNLWIVDNFDNEYIIPVDLEVEQYVDLPDPNAASKERLVSVYPNPFNGHIDIEVQMQSADKIQIEIIDLQGRTIRILENGHLNAGTHIIHWEGQTKKGDDVPPGVYFCRYSDSKTMVFKKIIKR
jgi:hypothetical protein